jgi:uncharacterized membrane protein YhaH (DUF805 family)
MGFGEAITSVLKNYITFTGRAPRSEYWFWALFLLIIGIVANILDAVVFPRSSVGSGPVSLIVSLGLLLPNISVGIRRLHDIDRTGWWLLICLIPIIGIIVLLVWACTRGTLGPNRFGPDPLPPGA